VTQVLNSFGEIIAHAHCSVDENKMSDASKKYIPCVPHKNNCTLFTGKQNYLLLNILRFALKICFERFFNVMQLILVKIK
jgi:hypothetical protein